MSSGLLRSMKAKLGGTPSKNNKGGPDKDGRLRNIDADKASNSMARENAGIDTSEPTKIDHTTSGPGDLSQSDLLELYKSLAFSPTTSLDLPIHYAAPLPSFRDVQPAERQALFIKKLRLCAVNFDFSEPSVQADEKETKRQTLMDLVDYVNSGPGKFTEAVSEDIIFMLSNNLFRAIPPYKPSVDPDSFEEEEEPNLEPAWPHLQLVYEFLLRYVVSSDTDAKLAKKYIDQQFVVKLLDLFDSEDPRERDYLKTILHRIYGKFMVHRPFIRRAINYVFYSFVFETERHAGIAELLEILGSIINGFALPLKEEHKQFLQRALMPLHKPKCLMAYQQQLQYCVTQFVEKDPRLAEPVLRGLLKFWPRTVSGKEVLFLSELEEVLELTVSEEFEKVLDPLFRQISKCLSSSHFQVAERSLFLWNNEYIVQLVAQHREKVLPLVVGALERNASHHWNTAVSTLSLNVRKMFMEMDGPLYERCKAEYEAEERSREELVERRSRQWEAIEIAASAKSSEPMSM